MALNRPKHLNKVYPLEPQKSRPPLTVGSWVEDREPDYLKDEQFNTSLANLTTVRVIQTSSPTTFDSAQDAWLDYSPIKFNTTTSFTAEYSNPRGYGNNYDGVIVYDGDSNIEYMNSVWTYGDAIRIYTDGTGAGVRFIDSDVFRGGANEVQMREDSTWDGWGGIFPETSAPDSAFRHDSDWESWNAFRHITTNNEKLNRLGYNSLDSANQFQFKVVQTLWPFDYDSTPVFYSQAAYDSAAGAGGGGGAAADPEAWS